MDLDFFLTVGSEIMSNGIVFDQINTIIIMNNDSKVVKQAEEKMEMCSFTITQNNQTLGPAGNLQEVMLQSRWNIYIAGE